MLVHFKSKCLFLRSVTTNTHSWQFIGIMFLMNWWLNVQKLGWNFAGKEGPLPISNSVAMHQVHNGNIFSESLQWKAMRCTHSNISAVCYSTANLCNLLEQVTFVSNFFTRKRNSRSCGFLFKLQAFACNILSNKKKVWTPLHKSPFQTKFHSGPSLADAGPSVR